MIRSLHLKGQDAVPKAFQLTEEHSRWEFQNLSSLGIPNNTPSQEKRSCVGDFLREMHFALANTSTQTMNPWIRPLKNRFFSEKSSVGLSVPLSEAQFRGVQACRCQGFVDYNVLQVLRKLEDIRKPLLTHMLKRYSYPQLQVATFILKFIRCRGQVTNVSPT